MTTVKTDIDNIEADVDSLQNKEIDTITYADNKLTLTHKDGTAKEVTIQHKLVNLADVDITSPNSGDVVTYSASTGKFTTGQVSSTDQYVKMTATDSNAGYLADLIDDDTIKNNNGKLEVEKIKGQTISVDELNTLLGMDTNVKDTLNALSSGGMVFKDVVGTYADLPNSAVNGFVYIVNADETDNGNRNAYIYSDDHAGFVLVGTSGLEVRNFTTNPIDLTSEVINVLPKDKMETTDLVDKTKDVINTLSYPIPDEDLAKIPNLEVLKQINTEVINALNGKMNNTDIVDNLTDNSVDKPLSANQGNVLDTKIEHKIDKANIVTTLDDTVTNEQVGSALATYNELDKKINKTSIATILNDTVTDEQVPSAKVVYTDLGKKVDKTSIVTTLNDTVTDEQIPSAKALYDDIKKGRIIFTDLPYGTDILAWADSLPDENFSQVYFCRANECVNKPPNVTDGFIMVRRIPNEKWIGLTWYDIRSTQTFECRKLNDVWGEWSTISPIKEGQVVNSNGGGVNYFKQIKNMVVVTCSNTTRLIYTWNVGVSINEGALPKPIIKIPVSIMSSNGDFYLAELDTDGYIKVKNRNIPATEDGNIYYYSFNYITDEL